jgi:hypothetical protein
MGSAVAAMQRRYRELRMPVVIMAGTKDRIVDHRKHSVRLHQEIAQSALRLAPGVGHMLHYAVPEQVVDAIEASFSNPTTLRSAAGKVEPKSASLETRLLLRGREQGAGATSFLRQENRMENPAVAPTTSTVIPAGHAALTTEDEVGEHRPDASAGLAGLSVAALGVVFGDIGTSPVYTFRECFNPQHGLPLESEHVLGVLSMIFWALIIVVAVKYVLLIMRADNQGEGGILALLALALEAARGERSRALLVLLSLGGAALFYGDSMRGPGHGLTNGGRGTQAA